MTQAMIWTFGILGFIVLITAASNLGSGRGHKGLLSRGEPTLWKDLAGLQTDLREIKDRLASIESVLREVD